MADETNKEILEEIGEGVTEGTTEGTQTEGTTGNGYLTKPYLVRNLQTFWGKIKQYIADKIEGFADKSYVTGVVDSAVKDIATKTDLEALTTKIDAKAEASDLTTLEETVKSKVDTNTFNEALEGKVDVDGNKVLSDNNFTNVFRDKLANLPASAATHTDMGFMSGDDKQKLDELVEKALTEVDEALSETSTNPVQNKIIKAALANKVDKEATPSDPSELIRLNNITSYATDEGHIVLNFIRDTEHLRIYTPNSDRPIEKVFLKDQNEVLFTNFQENDDETLAITIENPEGKNGDTWNITVGAFNFYIESLTVENKKYKPFILQAERSNLNDLTEISLNIIKIFET